MQVYIGNKSSVMFNGWKVWLYSFCSQICFDILRERCICLGDVNVRKKIFVVINGK